MSSVSEPAAAQSGNPELPTVSAVIPAYNAADTIERALNSVYAQTYENIIEVIVVDDGSTDNTAQIVRDKFPNVILIQQENAGSPTARNRGVEAASGQYIAFLDDDDEWFPEKTEAQMMCFRERPGLRMIIADAVKIVSGTERADSVDTDTPQIEPLSFREVFPLVPFHYGCSGWVLDTALFRECGGFALHMRRSQDTEWLWRMLWLGFSACRLRTELYNYTVRLDRSSDARARLARSWYDVMPTVVEQFAERALQSPAVLTQGDASRRLGEFYSFAGWTLWGTGLRDEARECLSRAAEFCEGWSAQSVRRKVAARVPKLYSILSRTKS